MLEEKQKIWLYDYSIVLYLIYVYVYVHCTFVDVVKVKNLKKKRRSMNEEIGGWHRGEMKASVKIITWIKRKMRHLTRKNRQLRIIWQSEKKNEKTMAVRMKKDEEDCSESFKEWAENATWGAFLRYLATHYSYMMKKFESFGDKYRGW